MRILAITSKFSGVGYQAGYSNTTGVSNSFVGKSAGLNNTTGANNSFFGFEAGGINTGGNGITAIGYQALANHSISGISNNTALGYLAGSALTTGQVNVYLGSETGSSHTTGSAGIYIGRLANSSSSSVGGETVIGYNIQGKGTDTAFIGNPSGAYNGANTTTWSTTSDQRLKKNIVDNNDGLEKINSIRVRNFEYRLPEEVTELATTTAVKKEGVQLGVIAQELQAVLPECVKTESTGVMSVDADNLTWYLVNAVKELTARIKQLEGN